MACVASIFDQCAKGLARNTLRSTLFLQPQTLFHICWVESKTEFLSYVHLSLKSCLSLAKTTVDLKSIANCYWTASKKFRCRSVQKYLWIYIIFFEISELKKSALFISCEVRYLYMLCFSSKILFLSFFFLSKILFLVQAVTSPVPAPKETYQNGLRTLTEVHSGFNVKKRAHPLH